MLKQISTNEMYMYIPRRKKKEKKCRLQAIYIWGPHSKASMARAG
jgi:hypothetical protein